jgi:hypothetical protein
MHACCHLLIMPIHEYADVYYMYVCMYVCIHAREKHMHIQIPLYIYTYANTRMLTTYWTYWQACSVVAKSVNNVSWRMFNEVYASVVSDAPQRRADGSDETATERSMLLAHMASALFITQHDDDYLERQRDGIAQVRFVSVWMLVCDVNVME